jgi:uncharacterized protein (DUF1684 family)
MRTGPLAAALAASLFLGAAPPAPPPSPEQTWRDTIKGENEIWSAKHHALLKIQDEALLGANGSATLLGTAGKPASYRWAQGVQPNGVAVIKLTGDKATVTLHGKTFDDAALKKGIAVEANVEIVSGGADSAFPGTVTTLILFNQVRAELLSFKGLDYFPYDKAYRVTATFTPDPKMPKHMFRLSRGADSLFYHVGDAKFSLNGKALILPFYAQSNDPKKIDDLEGYFTDDLTGKGTYGGGRYVSISDFGKFPPKSFTIDFNLAYNPLCARAPWFTCPIPTDALATPVKAGEKDPHQVH